MAAGKLIISFDCEGKWGMADRAPARLADISSTRLRETYALILAILKRYEVSATFGIVAALCLEREELAQVIRTTAPLLHAGRDWLEHPRAAIHAGSFEGWSEPELVRMILAEGRHEVCSHGGFHLPYDDADTDESAIAVDLALIERIRRQCDLVSRNLIYPRNIVGHGRLVAGAGIVAYREVDPQEALPGIAGRGLRLAQEFLNRDIGDLQAISTDSGIRPKPLSPGKFLSARIGLRKLVPLSVTVHRLQRLLDFAVNERRVVHLYSHPHNFMSDPSMADKLDRLLAIASGHRDRGVLEIITMADEYRLGQRSAA